MTAMTARIWLIENGYEDIAQLIDELMAELMERGSKQRRNWWRVLAGNKDGRPRVIAGREFPVLWAAQKRQGLKPTPNAIKRNKREKPPPIKPQGRWAKHKS